MELIPTAQDQIPGTGIREVIPALGIVGEVILDLGIGEAVEAIPDLGIGEVVEEIPGVGIPVVQAVPIVGHGRKGENMAGCLLALGLICIFIGIVQIFTHSGTSRSSTSSASASQIPFNPGNAYTFQKSEPIQQSIPTPVPMGNRNSNPMVDPSESFSGFQLGDQIVVPHPVQGELTVHIIGVAHFTELWQQSRGAQSPWVPTGNTFKGLWLENNLFLLNWQTRCYLLDEAIPTNDSEIQRDFASYARQFAQSDQTAEVIFSYPPATWRIVDIGKFQIARIEGSGFRTQVGGTGRFIHASGDSQRALVLEDYEGGSGQDMVWTGYSLEMNSIHKQ